MHLNPRSELDILVVLYQMAKAVNYVNNLHIRHNDIKPDNFIVSKTIHPIIKIIDFGFATSDSGEFSQGTPLFNAPERLFSDGGIGLKADVFSLGMTFVTILYGYNLFEKGTYYTVRHFVASVLNIQGFLRNFNKENSSLMSLVEINLFILRMITIIPEDRIEIGKVQEKLERHLKRFPKSHLYMKKGLNDGQHEWYDYVVYLKGNERELNVLYNKEIASIKKEELTNLWFRKKTYPNSFKAKLWFQTRCMFH